MGFFVCTTAHVRQSLNLQRLALFSREKQYVIFANAYCLISKTSFMGQNKLDKKQDNTVKATNPSDKNHKGDTERTSNQGRKEASGGSTQTNNRGQRKEA